MLFVIGHVSPSMRDIILAMEGTCDAVPSPIQPPHRGKHDSKYYRLAYVSQSLCVKLMEKETRILLVHDKSFPCCRCTILTSRPLFGSEASTLTRISQLVRLALVTDIIILFQLRWLILQNRGSYFTFKRPNHSR